MKIAGALGFRTRPIRLDLKDLDKLAIPSILHCDIEHFVVLQRVRREAIDILDPARGSRTLKHDEASRSFTGVALEMAPGL